MRKNRKTVALIGALLCAVSLLSAIALPTAAAAPPIPISLDNGKTVTGELIDSVTYIPLRRFCDTMGGATIEWNARTSTATVTDASRGLHMTVKQGAEYIIANGRYFYAPSGIRNVGGSLYVPIRPLAKAYSLEVTWSDVSRSVALTSTGKSLVSGDRFYKSDEVYWLSRIISAESRGEPFRGQIAVGNVVLNRVRSSAYPNTIYGVIFDRAGGVQFTPVLNGSIYNAPLGDSIIAAKRALNGESHAGKSLYFLNPKTAQSFWIVNNRIFYKSIAHSLLNISR